MAEDIVADILAYFEVMNPMHRNAASVRIVNGITFCVAAIEHTIHAEVQRVVSKLLWLPEPLKLDVGDPSQRSISCSLFTVNHHMTSILGTN